MQRLVAGILGLVFIGALLSPAAVAQLPGVTAPETPGSFEVVGHNSLMNRGMNAALAVKGKYAYVGSRSDGTKPNAGVMVVDVSDPTAPEVVHQIGIPDAGNDGETSREMRIWPQQNLLIVLNLASNCSSLIHACSPSQALKPDVFRFFDISGQKAAEPELIAEYEPSVRPHEFFLWVDPKKPKRALMFMSTPGGGQAAQLLVTDISGARAGRFNELAEWTTIIPDAQTDNRLHSLTITNDGKRGYVAYLGGGFFIIDTSDLARGKRNPIIELVTPIANRAHWGDPGAHSAVKLPGKNYALVTDEVYGQIPVLLAQHGCPWGWTRMIDVRNPRRPRVVAEFKLPENEEEFCESPLTNPPDRQTLSSFSAHNPTLTRNIALITWHSGGLQAMSTANPRRPMQLAELRPDPLPSVVTEDPVLSSGRDKVVMWSFPIVKDGLIYVVDVRNGLYIVDYKGPYRSEIKRTRFLEGNSNLGDALRFERP